MQKISKAQFDFLTVFDISVDPPELAMRTVTKISVVYYDHGGDRCVMATALLDCGHIDDLAAPWVQVGDICACQKCKRPDRRYRTDRGIELSVEE